MKYLLDTHVWLWMGLTPEAIGDRTRSLIADPKIALYLSIVSVWEMVVKTGCGKLNLPLDVQSFVRRFLPVSQSALLDLSLDHVFALVSLPEVHRDPFDRMLVAQARVEGMSLISADPHVLSYPVSSFDARQ